MPAAPRSAERLSAAVEASMPVAQTLLDEVGAKTADAVGVSRELGIAAMEVPSGAGHDAQDFAHAGIRAAMIFVRNSHGSHNPEEAMDIADFALGTRLLAWMLSTS